MAAKKRTTHRSTKKKKLYAKRGKSGEFEDVQRYKRAHGSDVKRLSKAVNLPRFSGHHAGILPQEVFIEKALSAS